MKATNKAKKEQATARKVAKGKQPRKENLLQLTDAFCQLCSSD
jgi:hypothetical protein